MLKILKDVIGGTLYEKRMGYGFTKRQMAEWCCISERQYSDLENYKRLPSMRTFMNIVLKCEIDVVQMIEKIVSSGYRVGDDRNGI